MKQLKVFVINPGSTSTKIALFEDRQAIFLKNIQHPVSELSQFKRIADQFAYRKQIIVNELEQAGLDLLSIDAIIGRGGLVKPVESGVYEVNEALHHDLIVGIQGEHASNLGGLIAEDIVKQITSARAFIADPVVVDELIPIARVTGLPMMSKRSIFHALNQKAVARKYARWLQRPYESLQLIVAHLGGGISIGVHQFGKVIDVNNALDGFGPFSPERAGSLPSGALVDLCFSGQYTHEHIKRLINGNGGLMAHLGTNNVQDVLQMARHGNAQAELLLDAMTFQIAKSIGACATVLSGKVDGIIITGGIAQSEELVTKITERIAFIGSVVVYPGEDEMLALAENAFDVLEGKVQCKVYC